LATARRCGKLQLACYDIIAHMNGLPMRPVTADPLGKRLRRPGRNSLIAGLFLLGMVNGIIGTATGAVVARGFWYALFDTFDVSLVVVIAGAVGVKLVSRAPERSLDRLDRLVIAVYLAGLCIPLSPASMAAVTFLALYEGLRSFGSAEATAASSLFLGVAACQMWGALFLGLFAPFILSLDAAIAAGALDLIQGGGVERVGNLVDTVQGQPLVIMTGCSSLSQVSYALLCWMTLVRMVRPSWDRFDLVTAAVLVIFVISTNVMRIALMGISPEAYSLVHGPVGSNVANALILIGALAAARQALARGPAPARVSAA
jgi:hypothetical protein